MIIFNTPTCQKEKLPVKTTYTSKTLLIPLINIIIISTFLNKQMATCGAKEFLFSPFDLHYFKGKIITVLMLVFS